MSIIDRHDIDAPIFDRAGFRLADDEADLIDRPAGSARGSWRRAPRNTIATRPSRSRTSATCTRRACSPSACRATEGGAGASFRTYCLAAAELGRYCGATALSWNMHVCSTLWTGALTDDLDITGEERAEHNRRREPALPADRRRGRDLLAAVLRRRRGRRRRGRLRHRGKTGGRRLSRSPARRSSPRSRAPPTITEYCAPSAAKARRRRAATRSTSRSRPRAPGVSVVGDWDPLGMRGTVSRTLLLKDVFVPEEEMLMPRGVYYRAATSWPHMFLTLSPTYMGLAQAAYDFTVAYLRGELPGMPPVKRRMYPTKQIAVAEMRIDARADQGAVVPGGQRGARQSRQGAGAARLRRAVHGDGELPMRSPPRRSAPAAARRC